MHFAGDAPPHSSEAAAVTGQSYSPFSEHQAGVVTPTPAAAELIAFDLKPDVDKAALGRMMRVWSTDISALMRGVPLAGDTLPDMAAQHVSLSVLVGLGPKVFTLDGLHDK